MPYLSIIILHIFDWLNGNILKSYVICGIRSRLVRDKPRAELHELAGGGHGETVLCECFGKLSPGKPVLLRVVEEAPKQRVNDVFLEGI